MISVQTYLTIIVFCTCDEGGPEAAGEGSVPWSLVDATELPSAGEVAEGAGEDFGEGHQAQSKLSLVDHHQPH